MATDEPSPVGTPPSTNRAFDRHALAILLAVNLLAHFVPFERPGFQQDDYFWLHLARTQPTSYISYGLSQPVRPLGSALYMLVPSTLGLHEGSQLTLLVGATSALTALVYFYLVGPLGRPTAALAALFYVLWPVKHEIYSAQLYLTNLTAACLTVGAGLLYRRAMLGGSGLALLCAVFAYALSIFTYEIGYFAPLLFYFVEERSARSRKGALLFLVPAALYWVLRWWWPLAGSISTGHHLLSLSGLAQGALSLPSNLLGFQLARNFAYGWWAVWNAPAWFKAACAASTLLVVLAVRFWTPHEVMQRAGLRKKLVLAGWGLISAVILVGPAGAILVESRHSILAAIGMAVAVTALVAGLTPPRATVVAVLLLVASQGLALRQAEVSTIQASVREEIGKHTPEIHDSSSVIFDLSGLTERVPYTWGDSTQNSFRVYWGMLGFTPGSFRFMVEEALFGRESAEDTASRRVFGCAETPQTTADTVTCRRSIGNGRPFSRPLARTIIIDFKTMPLPSSIRVRTTS